MRLSSAFTVNVPLKLLTRRTTRAMDGSGADLALARRGAALAFAQRGAALAFARRGAALGAMAPSHTDAVGVGLRPTRLSKHIYG